MNILIIGGCGFIGTNYAARCLKRGDNVTVIDNLSRATSQNNIQTLKKLGSHFVYHDVRFSFDSLAEHFRKADVVINLSAQVAVTTSISDPLTDLQINILGNFNCLEILRTLKSPAKYIFASTNKVYGDLSDVPLIEESLRYRFEENIRGISEEYPVDLYSPYGCSKGSADFYTKDFCRIYGVNTTVVRQSCIYGEYQYGIEDQGWLAWFAIAARQKKRISVFGNGKQVRDVLYCDDLLDLYDAIIEKNEISMGETYNAGGGLTNSISLLELLEFLKETKFSELSWIFDEERQGDQKIFISDNSKANEDLGWAPQVHWKDGINKMLKWFEANNV